MTEAQLEIAAREFCRLRGLNPEQRIRRDEQFAPRWWHYKHDMELLAYQITALEFAGICELEGE
jgi:hypothetical protein